MSAQVVVVRGWEGVAQDNGALGDRVRSLSWW